MITVTTSAELHRVLKPLRSGRIGFVPTMGALHEGHLALLRSARSHNDTVVLSIFVNPTQFDEASDLESYPRATAEDLTLAASAGVDVAFLPAVEEIYPPGFTTSVSVAGPITETLEGAVRGRNHFDGVATVVAKLLLAVLPDAAYFGAKDAQQVVVVTRMVADLGIPVDIAVVPTSRDVDGLARSSRNTRLSQGQRAQARAIPQALQAIQDAAARGETEPGILVRAGERVLESAGLAAEYLAIVDPATLAPVTTVGEHALVVVAVAIGSTRLIDNTMIGDHTTVVAAPDASRRSDE